MKRRLELAKCTIDGAKRRQKQSDLNEGEAMTKIECA